MTNKLRSVIEDQETFVRTVSYQITVEEDNAVPLRLARKALHRLTTGILDAIIEEIPAIPDYDFLDASKSTEEKMLEGGERLGAHKYRQSVLNKLINAREELSTSLT